MNSKNAQNALEQIFEFLDHSVSQESGLWGMIGEVNNTNALSVGVQTSYHLWNLYFYEKRRIPHIEKAIDQCLKTQNSLGGYRTRGRANSLH